MAMASKSECSHDSKKQIDLDTKENQVSWLANISESTTGTKQELKIRVNRLLRFTKLIEKLKAKTFTFDCSLNANDIPPATAKWRTTTDNLPSVTSNLFKQYTLKKREGSMGQQRTALQMLASGKIVNINKNSRRWKPDLCKSNDKEILRYCTASSCYDVL